MADERRERELVLDSIQFAFILDKTKGNIIVYVGPHKTSLSNTDEPVYYDAANRCFVPCQIDNAIKQCVSAKEGQYIVLENPSDKDDEKNPRPGPNNLVKLMIGRKINIAGPITFPLWPTQTAVTISGHQLRSNQYLLVRVYNEEAAKSDWQKAVVKLQKNVEDDSVAPEKEGEKKSESIMGVHDLTMGKLLIIKGTEVSFYIPPTGIEVLPDSNGNYVRNAVTLERLEYCILLDEDGNKRYVQGPAVVFPMPTEVFMESKNGMKKFKAIELNEISGIYVKVIAPYKDEKSGKEYQPGDEIFITGKDTMIYYPRAEHAIIKYGEQEIHYAVAIPEGEGRYVLDRINGKIDLVTGPCMLLPDPRRQVIVRRVLSERVCSLLYPNNYEALEYNKKLSKVTEQSKESYIMEQNLRSKKEMAQLSERVQRQDEIISGDDFQRKNHYTQPRTITLDTNYDGAVLIKVWSGYAVLVVSKTGERRVVVGPKPILLKYDETLETITLSTGKPKGTGNIMETVYLRFFSNKVTDVVEIETKDMCKLDILLSYRVNFEGDPNKWFDVENYVKFLCDHMRSMLKNITKHYSIDEFYKNNVEIIRDTVLGKTDETVKSRPGRLFQENGMRIYDVEVLDINIKDDEIQEMLARTQRTIIEQDIQIELAKKKYELTQEIEIFNRKEAEEKSITKQRNIDYGIMETKKEMELQVSKLLIGLEVAAKQLQKEEENQKVKNKMALEQLKIDKSRIEQELELNKERLLQKIEEIKADADAMVIKSNAITPELIAAMQSFADKELAGKLAESMAPMSILGGKSVVDIVSNMLGGTGLDSVIRNIGLGKDGIKK